MPNKYDSVNKSLLRRIPAAAGRNLDVGCDTGLMGAALKDRDPACQVVGVELNPDTANIARSRVDEVHVLNIEHDNLDKLGDGYDAIIFGDVLEHLYDPETCLRRL